MTIDEIKARVSKIEALADDECDAMAHEAEDELYRDVLQSIANSVPAPFSDMAREALKAYDIGFSRWFS